MGYYDNGGFPWIKFGIITVVFMVLIWKLAGGLDLMWRVMFTLCSPVGVGLALAGKSMRKRNRWK